MSDSGTPDGGSSSGWDSSSGGSAPDGGFASSDTTFSSFDGDATSTSFESAGPGPLNPPVLPGPHGGFAGPDRPDRLGDLGSPLPPYEPWVPGTQPRLEDAPQPHGVPGPTRDHLGQPPIVPQPLITRRPTVVRRSKGSTVGVVVAAALAGILGLGFLSATSSWNSVSSGGISQAQVAADDQLAADEIDIANGGEAVIEEQEIEVEFDKTDVNPTRFLTDAGVKASRTTPKVAIHVILRNDSDKNADWTPKKITLHSANGEIQASLTATKVLQGPVLTSGLAMLPGSSTTGWVVFDVEDPDAVKSIEYAGNSVGDAR